MDDRLKSCGLTILILLVVAIFYIIIYYTTDGNGNGGGSYYGDQDLEEAEVVVEEAEVVADAFLLTPWYGRKTNHLQTRLQLK